MRSGDAQRRNRPSLSFSGNDMAGGCFKILPPKTLKAPQHKTQNTKHKTQNKEHTPHARHRQAKTTTTTAAAAATTATTTATTTAAAASTTTTTTT